MDEWIQNTICGGNSTVAAFSVSVLVHVMAHIHALYYHKCSCVSSMLLEPSFHASAVLTEPNHRGGAPALAQISQLHCGKSVGGFNT